MGDTIQKSWNGGHNGRHLEFIEMLNEASYIIIGVNVVDNIIIGFNVVDNIIIGLNVVDNIIIDVNVVDNIIIDVNVVAAADSAEAVFSNSDDNYIVCWLREFQK